MNACCIGMSIPINFIYKQWNLNNFHIIFFSQPFFFFSQQFKKVKKQTNKQTHILSLQAIEKQVVGRTSPMGHNLLTPGLNLWFAKQEPQWSQDPFSKSICIDVKPDFLCTLQPKQCTTDWMRMRLPSIKPETEEICKNVKQCHSSH